MIEFSIFYCDSFVLVYGNCILTEKLKVDSNNSLLTNQVSMTVPFLNILTFFRKYTAQ